MGVIRRGVEELTFRGVKLTFEKRSRYRIIMRVDNKAESTHENVNVVEVVSVLTELVHRVTGPGIKISATTKITLERGYLLFFTAERGDTSVLISIELFR